MSELGADYQRCNATYIAFDLVASQLVKLMYGWQISKEAFWICQHCNKSAVFIVARRGTDQNLFIKQAKCMEKVASADNFVEVESHVSLHDTTSIELSEYLPPETHTVF